MHCFSKVVELKSRNIRKALESKGVEIVPWSEMESSDGGIIYNIHGSVERQLKDANKIGKKLISLQEGMYAVNWKKTLPGMKDECRRANSLKVHQIVWSQLDLQNYIFTGKDLKLIEALGNPEYDDFQKEPKFTRKDYGIPDDAVVVCHLCQYEHPNGGPTNEQFNFMIKDIKNLKKLDSNIYVIHCLHPNQRVPLMYQKEERVIVRPFEYPVADIIRFSDVVITVSSTEAITAAVLKKPLILYDISQSPERWPFSAHGVGLKIVNEKELQLAMKSILDKTYSVNSYVDYSKAYLVDGNTSNKIADRIIKYFG